MTMQETRRAERRHADQPSTLRAMGSEPHDSWVHDVSSTGMRIECRAELEIGEEITVGLAGAGATRARVVWRNGAEYGCTFVEPLSEKAAEKAFSGSPIVRLHPIQKIADIDDDLARAIDGGASSGRLWMAALAGSMIAVAAPAAILLARLTS